MSSVLLTEAEVDELQKWSEAKVTMYTRLDELSELLKLNDKDITCEAAQEILELTRTPCREMPYE